MRSFFVAKLTKPECFGTVIELPVCIMILVRATSTLLLLLTYSAFLGQAFAVDGPQICHGQVVPGQFSGESLYDWDLSLRQVNHEEITSLDEFVSLTKPSEFPEISSDDPKEFFKVLGRKIKAREIFELWQLEAALSCYGSKGPSKLLRPSTFAEQVSSQCEEVRSSIRRELLELLPTYRKSVAVLQKLEPNHFVEKHYARDMDDFVSSRLNYPFAVKPFAFFNRLDPLEDFEKARILSEVIATLQPLSQEQILSPEDLALFLGHNQVYSKKLKVVEALEPLYARHQEQMADSISKLPLLAYYSSSDPYDDRAVFKAPEELYKNRLDLASEALTLDTLNKYPRSLVYSAVSQSNKKFCSAVQHWDKTVKEKESALAMTWLVADIGVCAFSVITGAWPLCVGMLGLHAGTTLYGSTAMMNDDRQRAFSTAFKTDLASSYKKLKSSSDQFAIDLLLAPASFAATAKVGVSAAKALPDTKVGGFGRKLFVDKKQVEEPKGPLMTTIHKYILSPVSCLFAVCRPVVNSVEKIMRVKPHEQIRAWWSQPALGLGMMFEVYPRLGEEYTKARIRNIIYNDEHRFFKYLKGFRGRLSGETFYVLKDIMPALYKVHDEKLYQLLLPLLESKKISVLELPAKIEFIDKEMELLAEHASYRGLFLGAKRGQYSVKTAASYRDQIDQAYIEYTDVLYNSSANILRWSELVESTEKGERLVGFRFKSLDTNYIRSLNDSLRSNRNLLELAKQFGLYQAYLDKLSPEDRKEALSLIQDYLFLRWAFEAVSMETLYGLEPVYTYYGLAGEVTESLVDEFNKLIQEYLSAEGTTASEVSLHLEKLADLQRATSENPVSVQGNWKLEEMPSPKTTGATVGEHLSLLYQVKINEILGRYNLTPYYKPYGVEGSEPLKVGELSSYSFRLNLTSLPKVKVIHDGPTPSLLEIVDGLKEEAKTEFVRRFIIP